MRMMLVVFQEITAFLLVHQLLPRTGLSTVMSRSMVTRTSVEDCTRNLGRKESDKRAANDV
jgi:hypothetical protein